MQGEQGNQNPNQANEPATFEQPNPGPQQASAPPNPADPSGQQAGGTPANVDQVKAHQIAHELHAEIQRAHQQGRSAPAGYAAPPVGGAFGNILQALGITPAELASFLSSTLT